jgi:hypothetical protein
MDDVGGAAIAEIDDIARRQKALPVMNADGNLVIE